LHNCKSCFEIPSFITFHVYFFIFFILGNTLISEFDLVCDRKTLNNVSEMMFLGGVAIGGLVCGILSDKYGRKKTLMASVFFQTLLGVIIAFAPWFQMYFILRAALGFISVSVVFSGFVLSIELVGGNWRTVAGISYLFPVSLSYITIAGMGWLLRDWRQLQLAISLPGLIFLILWWDCYFESETKRPDRLF
jgi:MFS family permease